MTKKITILGSTGSIGKNALRVIDSLGSNYDLVAISAHTNVKLLAEQIHKYKPAYAAITDPNYYKQLRDLVSGENTEILCGPKSLVELASLSEVDTVITAVVGAAGLAAVLEGAKTGKLLAIANKEPLVIAGELLMKTARSNGARIMPIDSEHSAIFQAMQAGNADEVQKIILTSSGGPFRNATLAEIQNATLEDALNHPTWDMGPKITIDSASMMNKALEVIEARWLFDVPVERIDVLIHPESIVHSMVEFIDGSVVAQLGTPDMCLPIQYSLTYPERKKGITSHLDLTKLGSLNFATPDLELFPALRIGFEVAKKGGSSPVVFNAANEAAVEHFLSGRIRFVQIVELISAALEEHTEVNSLSLDELLERDKWAREFVNSNVDSI